jgi:cytoskeletal protein CcmA (bactofilin family)
MLSNFTARKGDKDVQGAAAALTSIAAAAAPPPPPAAQRVAAPAARTAERAQPSVIGPDLVIVGNLTSKGEVMVDGEIQGDLYGSHIVVGESARITGGVVGEEVVIRGHVMGSVRGRRVVLQATSHVEGDVFHQTLAIEQGAYFEGKSRRSEDPLASAPASPGALPLPSTG